MTLGVGLSLPVQEQLTARQYLELAQQAERRGYDAVFIGEIASTDAIAMATLVASHTSTISVSTGVVSIYTRSPALAAMGFATAASLAPGRIMAGLGTGSRVVVEDWHGRVLSDPQATTREFVAAFRAAMSGNRVDLPGPHLSVRDFRLQVPVSAKIPVYLGSFGPAMLRLAGALADGVILAFCPVWGLPERVAQVRQGCADAGRDPRDVEIVAYVNAYAGDEVAAALDRFRRLVLQYAVQPTHRAGFVDVFPRIDDATVLWNRGERSKALGLVPDEAVHELCPIGSAGHVAARLDAVRAAGVDLPVLFPQSLVPGDADTPAATVERVAGVLSSRGRAAPDWRRHGR